MSVTLPEDAWAALISAAAEKNVYIEGSLLRILDPEEKPECTQYLDEAVSKDRQKRETRLEVTKKAQEERRELGTAYDTNEELRKELEASLLRTETARGQAEQAREEADDHRKLAEEARHRAEQAKATAEGELDYMQKQTQFQLMHQIVSSAIYVVIGVGLITTGLYVFLILRGADSAQVTMMGNAWTNMFGILLTNSFSIIGTVMGVKYATENKGDSGA
jgi:hypothetical protein